MNLKELEALIRLVEQSEISELEITKFLGRKIRISKVLKKSREENPGSVTEIEVKKENPTRTENLVAIKSPMVGTFYRAPAPDAPPYVEVGDIVRPGQVVCIVEAMKLMNEIESEVEGEIVKILVKNEEPVEYGQDLFLVRPLGG
ncbi:acetyl-CoA carboxylase, biotin carboxyl carrier protein [candidate division WOR-3 bacterium]|uniref:Biotin carboxyl carrier protein of acetyl-CoA carboxylase n=1 Tax=candidate division WOR-3 bacterium TaxID=2052148 RepID=A0A660SMN1_UNCW3|nr:MAG: acetyl-CoA carboxylase, biotin carboxyl carrier protein [candidate division WOR-3 bacterium]